MEIKPFESAGKVFVCPKCPDRIYRSTFALGRHMKEIHNLKLPSNRTPKRPPVTVKFSKLF